MSLFALVDGRPARATPAATGSCPGCGREMLAKCGHLVTWHWAHAASEACDPWRLGETDWHLQTKERFLAAGARIEVPIEKNGDRHIADVVLPDGQVVELAGVYPPADQVAEREAFYGRMRWIYNAESFLDRVEEYTKGVELRFRFKQPVAVMTRHRRPVHWHDAVGDRACQLVWLKRYQDDDQRRTYGRLTFWEPMADLIEDLITTGAPIQ